MPRPSLCAPIPLEKVAAEPLVALWRKDNPSYYHTLDRLFGAVGVKPRIEAEYDTFSSLMAAVQSGRGIALSTSVFKQVTAKRLVYQPVTGTNEVL
jgi:DNA-binding transcriptional LysR family regulator